MKRVLVTGARGFIGRQCLAPLKELGYEVHGASSQLVTDGRRGMTWHRTDLFDWRAVEKLVARVRPTHLLHLAWVTEPGQFWTDSENEDWVDASVHLVEQFVAHGGRRCVVSGTCAEYDWNQGCCHEQSTPLNAATLYGQSKRALHTQLDELAAGSELSLAWGRLFFLFGPHAPLQKFPAAVISDLLSGNPSLCSHGEQVRDFLHVADAADALVTLLDSNVEGALNIASGEGARLADIVQMIAGQIGRPELVTLGALETPSEEPPVLTADVGRLKGELNWSPKFDLQQGLQQTIQWWMENVHSHAA